MKNINGVLLILCVSFLSSVSLAESGGTAHKITTEIIDAGSATSSSGIYRLLGKSRGSALSSPAGSIFIIGEGFLRSVYFKVISLSPVVTGIVPSTGVNTGTVNITDLSGANFRAGAAVKLKKNGQPDIIASNVFVKSAVSISCVFNISGAEVGYWDVEVINPDGRSGSLPRAFKVEKAGIEILGQVVSNKNPFNPATGPAGIKYTLSKDANITVYIYNIRGERIWQFDTPAGSPGGQVGDNEVIWNGVTAFKTLAQAGVYIIHITARVDGEIKVLATYKLAVVK